jgi:hypothetical protein
LIGTAVPVFGQGDGGQLGSTIRMGQGARALAMGSAFTAVADDASAVYFNPAGLTQIGAPGVDFAWRVMPLLDRKQGYFDAAFPLRDEAALAFAWVYSGVGDIVERNDRGEAGDAYSFSENMISATFAKQFGRVLSVGGSLHFVHQSLFEVSANTIGGSVGLHARFDRPHRSPFSDALSRLSLAAAVQHLGMTMRFDSDDYYAPRGGSGGTATEDFPMTVRTAAAYRILNDRSLLLSAEGAIVENQHLRGYFGAEWQAYPRLLLRGGVAEGQPTLGIGLRQPWGSTSIRIDYAFLTSPVGEDPDHVIALGVGF